MRRAKKMLAELAVLRPPVVQRWISEGHSDGHRAGTMIGR